MTELITPVQLRALMEDGHDVVLLCAYSSTKPATDAIPGAFVADLEGDFSDHSNPLPHTAPADLASLFASYGVNNSSTVVVYDMQRGAFAPRVWWLAKVAGIADVRLLDGGLKAWKAAGFDTASFSTPEAAGDFSGERNDELLVYAPDIESGERLVLDARSHDRFIGEADEPRPGMKKGHIPGSVNLPFTDVYNPEDGTFKSPAALKELFESAAGERTDLTFSCGSGVTACVLAAAAGLAGYDDLAVYEGSWSEWGSKEADFPVEV